MKVALRWILGIFIMMLGFEEYSGPSQFSPAFMIGVVLFLAFVLALLIGEIRIRFTRVGALMALFAAFALSSTVWSVNPDRTFHYAVMMVELLLVTWITASCIEDESNLELIAWFLALSSVYPSLFLVGNYLAHGTQIQDVARYGERLSFAGADPNLSAYRFVVSILSAIHLALISQSRGFKILLIGLACLFVAASLLTGSRGGALALIISTMALLLANLRQKKGPVLLIMAGLAALLLVAMPFLPTGVSARYLGLEEEVATGTMANRKIIYREARNSFEMRPLLGVGYQAFESVSRQRGGLGQSAHNDTIEIAVDLGLVGLGMYLLLMAAMIWEVASAPPQWKGFVLGLFAAYLVSGSSIDLITTKIPWIAFGVFLGARSLARPASSVPRTSVWDRWSAKGLHPNG